MKCDLRSSYQLFLGEGLSDVTRCNVLDAWKCQYLQTVTFLKDMRLITVNLNKAVSNWKLK